MPIHPSAFIHERATVLGDVTLGARTSVWPSAVIRADTAPVVIGSETSVQDGTVIHVDLDVPVHVGSRVTIGHRAIIHGATIEDDCLIGMGAIVLNHVRVGRGSIVGAGALCTEGMEIPPNSVVLGVPAKVVRETTPEMRERIQAGVESYLALQEEHRRGKHQAHRSADD
ncbi:MAG TPA: gamma carbonic anhydrase family protein [Gemmatimonadaceae bacterium]|nr:gamma carbonic anhydrase family protein [Gemmatimonadaceae bacterium]